MTSFKKEINKKKDKKSKIDSRLIFLSAIIFFMFTSLILRLYKIQVVDFDIYIAKAGLQHNIYNELKAKRGNIYLENSLGEDFHLIASNKNFASLYIIPRLLDEEYTLRILECIYLTFHHDLVVEAVDDFLEEKDKQDLFDELKYVDSLSLSYEEKAKMKKEVEGRRAGLSLNEEWMEFRRVQRDLEIEERKQSVISDYFLKFKNSDKYSRLLVRKVERENLLLFYYNFFKDEFGIDSLSDVFIKNGKVLIVDRELDLSNEIDGFYYEWESLRYYPEKSLLSHVTGFSNYDNVGNYGLEGFFNEELTGVDGFLLGDKGAYKGKRIVIDKEDFKAPVNGSSIVLTIDYAVQTYVCSKLREFSEKYLFDSGSVSIMNPSTGEIVALCVWPEFDANNYQDVPSSDFFDNQVVSYQYEPGSVFKAITMAAAIDQGKINPSTIYEDKGQLMISGWPKPITNSDFKSHGAHGMVSINYALEKSLNTGAIFAAEQIGKDTFADYLKKFGFGEKLGVELVGESPGNIKNIAGQNVKDIDFSTASFGQGIAVTPLQMLSSYATIANKGIMMKPYIVKEVLDEDFEAVKRVEPREVRRVISEEAALATSAMLVNVIENGHAFGAQVEGYYVGGKTGTAQIPSVKGGYIEGQYIHNFIGYAPINNPKFVMLVKFDNPKTVGFAANSTAPVFGEISDFLLKYYQIPQERK